MTIIEYVQKLFDLETKIGEKIGELKTRNHLEKYEKKLRLKELKKIRCWRVLTIYIFMFRTFWESLPIFSFKVEIFQFLWKFYSWFWKLPFFTFKWIGRWRSEEKCLENNSSVELRDKNKSSFDNKLNVKDHAAKMLGNRLQWDFLVKNVVNLSRQNLTDFEVSSLSKSLILFRLPI